MNRSVLVVALALSGALFATTTVKNSAPFSFPTVVGVKGGQHLQDITEVFAGGYNPAGGRTVTLSWSLPVKAERGSISIFNITGSKIRTFPIGSSRGYVVWDLSGEKRVGNGIYFATLSYGSCKKNLQLVICR